MDLYKCGSCTALHGILVSLWPSMLTAKHVLKCSQMHMMVVCVCALERMDSSAVVIGLCWPQTWPRHAAEIRNGS